MVVNLNATFKVVTCHVAFAVIDGHGGDACAQFIRSKLYRLVEDNLNNGDYEASLVGAFNDAETMWTKTSTTTGGPGWIVDPVFVQLCFHLMHASMCVGLETAGLAYSTQDGCVAITSDHKPDRASERARFKVAVEK